MNNFTNKILSNNKLTYLKTSFKWVGYFINRYTIVGVAFIIWMLFFDQNSLITHRELDKQIKTLERDEAYFQKNLENENQKLKMLQNNPAEIERIAREKFYLKKDNEDIFIIQQEIQKQPQEKTKNE